MDPHRKRVLCVEDEEETCALIRNLLGLINCEVITAGTYEEALSRIRGEQFDLYLLDTWLPGGSGVDLCKMIRERDGSVPVVFFSGAAYDSDERAAIRAGAHAYLVKPRDVGLLVECVKSLLSDDLRQDR